MDALQSIAVGLKIGITATRHGMSPAQKQQVEMLVRGWEPTEWHQGCCAGGDEESVEIVRRVLGFWRDNGRCKIVGHPGPDGDPWRSPVLCDEYREPTSHFQRNRNIVNGVDFMLGVPLETVEMPYGGTWYTIRYARKVGRPIEVVFP